MIVEQMVGVGRRVLVEDRAMETLALEQNIMMEEEEGRALEEAGGKLEKTVMETEDGKLIQGLVEETLVVTTMMEEEGKLEETIMGPEDGKLIQVLVEEQSRVLVAALLVVPIMLQCVLSGVTAKRLDTSQEDHLGEEMEKTVLEEDVFGEGKGGRTNKYDRMTNSPDMPKTMLHSVGQRDDINK